VLEACKLEQVRDYVKPFNLMVEGFNPGWWRDRAGRVGDYPNVELLSFVDAGEEVARAETDTAATLYDRYVGLSAPRVVTEVRFIEVRADLRGRGIGSSIVKLLEERYRDETMFAFSEGADRFWVHANWKYYSRVDGDTRFLRPLFLRHPSAVVKS